MTRIINQYYRPKDWNELDKLLNNSNSSAGPIMLSARPNAVYGRDVETALDLSELGLSYIKTNGDRIEIGAMTDLQTIVESELLASLVGHAINDAATHMGRINMRNQACISGVLMDLEGPSELQVVLLALDAILTLRKGDKLRKISLADFYRADAAIETGELITAIDFAAHFDGAMGCERLSRTPQDMAIEFAAVYLEADHGVISKAAVSFSGIAPMWQRVPEAEAILTGKRFDADVLSVACESVVKAACPVSDFRGSKEYRKNVSSVIARRAIEKAWKQL